MEQIAAARATAPALPRRGFPELVCVSRLTPEKEFVKLVEAFRLLLKSMPDAKLTIVGDGPEKEAVKAAAAQELGNSIFMTGAVHDELTIASHMNRADAFVIAGRVGLAINHALGYGLPVFCFRRTAAGPLHGSEITHLKPGRTGYFVEPYEAPAMAEMLARILQHVPDLKQQHEPVIKTYVAQHMSIPRMFEGFKALSEHLAVQHPRQLFTAQAQ
jgi:glycosyltransferase involved in cell wall biosynthesis